MKRQMLITPDELIKFMGKENYTKFIKSLVERSKHEDYNTIKKKEIIWILAEW